MDEPFIDPIRVYPSYLVTLIENLRDDILECSRKRRRLNETQERLLTDICDGAIAWARGEEPMFLGCRRMPKDADGPPDPQRLDAS